MFKFEPATAEEFCELSKRAIEQGGSEPADMLAGFKITKLTMDDEPLCALIEVPELDYGLIYVGGVFLPECSKYLKTVVKMGRLFLDEIRTFPLTAIAERDNVKYNKMLVTLGFVDCDKDITFDNKVYNVYVRC